MRCGTCQEATCTLAFSSIVSPGCVPVGVVVTAATASELIFPCFLEGFR